LVVPILLYYDIKLKRHRNYSRTTIWQFIFYAYEELLEEAIMKILPGNCRVGSQQVSFIDLWIFLFLVFFNFQFHFIFWISMHRLLSFVYHIHLHAKIFNTTLTLRFKLHLFLPKNVYSTLRDLWTYDTVN
jgi:hypothetical protein